MTAPSPDPYIAKAQQRVLTLAEKSKLSPFDRLVLIRNSALNLRHHADWQPSMVDKLTLDLLVDLVDTVTDLVDVVEQIAGRGE